MSWGLSSFNYRVMQTQYAAGIKVVKVSSIVLRISPNFNYGLPLHPVNSRFPRQALRLQLRNSSQNSSSLSAEGLYKSQSPAATLLTVKTHVDGVVHAPCPRHISCLSSFLFPEEGHRSKCTVQNSQSNTRSGIHDQEGGRAEGNESITGEEREESGFQRPLATPREASHSPPFTSGQAACATFLAVLGAAFLPAVAWAAILLCCCAGAAAAFGRKLYIAHEEKKALLRRTVVHEAGHLLVAYLCGFQICGYTLTAARGAASSAADTCPHVEFSHAAVEESLKRAGGSSSRSSDRSGSAAAHTSGVDERTLGLYATVLLAGAAAEWLHFGSLPQGAEEDVRLLRQGIARMRPHWSRARAGAFFGRALRRATIIVRAHARALEPLAALMAQGASLESCFALVDKLHFGPAPSKKETEEGVWLNLG